MPILQKSVDAYILWHKNVGNLSRFSRATLGVKIDTLFTDVVELLLRAQYIARDEKLLIVEQAVVKLDALKYFLHIMHRTDELPEKKYLEISAFLYEAGKMLGGWRKQIMNTVYASQS